MNHRARPVGIFLAISLIGFLWGCPSVQMPPGTGGGEGGGNMPPATPPPPPDAFKNADGIRGGKLYDKYWKVVGLAEPTGDHQLWATRPDMDSNTRTGPDTWRCKECHGWDYKGVDGAYGTGDHRTGFKGIDGATSMSAQAVFDLISGGTHGYAAAGLADADIWDLAKFVLERQIDTTEIIDTGGKFVGSATTGQPLFQVCEVCHGADGLQTPPGADPDFADYPGFVSNENPWEFQHKVRFGQPGTPIMPPQADNLTVEQLGDFGAFAQTLPQMP